ncbi:MAG: hypothetical protein KIT80_04905 [Chitinophagaceae bacterium]|nr:hypothetical protein [Chitinophagaceae bacterium]MCW5926232.1 hypothetical protein [Chitinophagaceae bacterium]
MQKKKPDVDIVLDLLTTVQEAKPHSAFIKSLLFQYQERGGLSKKQLEGLYFKAAEVKTIPEKKLITLQAIIKKKPTRFKSTLPAPAPLYTKDETTGTLINDILVKYPQHKRVLFLKARYDNNETLTPAEISELQKFRKLLT